MRTLTQEEMKSVSGGCGRNNGWGNGDDNAPGNSLTHNRAENNVRPGAAHKGTVANPVPGNNDCGGGVVVPPA